MMTELYIFHFILPYNSSPSLMLGSLFVTYSRRITFCIVIKLPRHCCWALFSSHLFPHFWVDSVDNVNIINYVYGDESHMRSDQEFTVRESLKGRISLIYSHVKFRS